MTYSKHGYIYYVNQSMLWLVTTGVHIANNRYVPVGAVITTQTAANRLPFSHQQLHLKASTIAQFKPVSYLQVV